MQLHGSRIDFSMLITNPAASNPYLTRLLCSIAASFPFTATMPSSKYIIALRLLPYKYLTMASVT